MARKLALIIGNDEYDDQGLARLVTPAADVSALGAVLRDPNVGGFDEVAPLHNEPANSVQRAIARFFAQKNPSDLLLLYFSGHGVLDEEGRLYLAVKDTERELLSGTAIPAAFLTSEMDRSRSRQQVLILDCCHSGAFARGAKGALGASVGTSEAFRGAAGFGRVVLTATDATQYAWEGDQLIGEAESSVFTHYLVEGLRTGEADLDADGQISLDELYDYVYEQVVTKTPRQTPGKWAYKQQGEIVIARGARPARRPARLPPELLEDIESTYPWKREGALSELERLLRGSHSGLALAAEEALQRLSQDDSRRVASRAAEILRAFAGAPPGEARPLAEETPAVAPSPPAAVSPPVAPIQPTGPASEPLPAVEPAVAVPPPEPVLPAREQEVMPLEMSGAPEEPVPEKKPRLTRRQVMLAGAGVAILLVAVFIGPTVKEWLWPEPAPPEESQLTRAPERLGAAREPEKGGAGPAGIAQYALQSSLGGHGNEVMGVAYSPDGRTLASAGRDSRINFWDVAAGRLTRTVNHEDAFAAAFSHDGRLLASGGLHSGLSLWDLSAGRNLGALGDRGESVYSVAFSPDDRVLASAAWGGVRVWDVAGRRALRSLDAQDCLAVAFTRDGRWLASGHLLAKTVKIWDTATWKQRHALKHTHGLHTVAFSPDGNLLAAGGEDKLVTIWDVATGARLRTLSGFAGKVRSVAFRPDGRLLAVGSWREAQLWDTASWAKVQSLPHEVPGGDANRLGVNAVAFSPDGLWLATGGMDKARVRLWRAAAR